MTGTKAVMRPATGTLAPRITPAVAAPKGPHAARSTACAARWRTGNNGNGAAPSAPTNDNSAAAASVSVKDLPSPPPASPPPAEVAPPAKAPVYVPPPAAGETGGLLNGAFAAALSAALSRGGGQGSLFEGSVEEERESPLKPVEEMLVTALHSSRANVRRLVDRQSQLEAEIAAEQKQAQRLEWLLNRVRSDYSYFAELDRMSNSE